MDVAEFADLEKGLRIYRSSREYAGMIADHVHQRERKI